MHTVERDGTDDTRYARELGVTSAPARWPVSRVTHVVAGITLVAGWGLAPAAAAQVSDRLPVVTVTTLTPERIAAAVAAVVGLIGAIIGGGALVRSARHVGPGNGRRGAIVALVMGTIGLVIGGLVVVTADGGLGTGNGLGGAVVAMVVGIIGMTLGWLALARSRGIA
jgi:hypothetical protein